MNFIVFEGALGSGKTNGAVLFANYAAANSDAVLYSNFDMKNAKPFTSLYQLTELAYNPSSIVVLDETHIDLDSRSFNTNHVKFISQSAFWLRKLRTTFIMTSPLYENLDSRIRGVTNMLVHAEKGREYFYYHCYDIQHDKFLTTKKIKKENAFRYKLYDTNGIVTPLQVPENKQEYDKFLIDLKYHTDNYYKKQTDGETATVKSLAVGG